MKRLAIIGSGDLAQLMAHHALLLGNYQLVGFFDDFQQSGTQVGLGTVLGPIDSLASAFQGNVYDELMCAIGYRHFNVRGNLFEQLNKTVPFATIIHRSCAVDPSASIGAGCFLLPGVVVDRNARIESNVVLNASCSISHDSSVGSHTFVAPGVVLAGCVTIGRSCFLGTGTVVIDNVELKNHIQTGGGTVVTKSLAEPGLYVGAPARKIR